MTGQSGQLALSHVAMALRQDLDNVTIHHHSMEEMTAMGQLVRKKFVSGTHALVNNHQMVSPMSVTYLVHALHSYTNLTNTNMMFSCGLYPLTYNSH